MNGEPIRISALNSLAKCPGLVCSRTVTPSESGQAADTGSAVGRLIELWHAGLSVEDARRKAEAEMPEQFPKADWEGAVKRALLYCADERNPPGVVVPGSCELEVVLRLEADEDDPTGEPIVLTGHVDQIRWAHPDSEDREALGMRVWDVKDGRASGDDMTRDYAYQLAAYAVACSDHFGEPVLPGGIIRTKGYIARGANDPSEANVFYYTPWTLEQCHAILRQVAYMIGQIRAGAVLRQPGSWCRWCPLDFPGCSGGDLERLLGSDE